MIYTRVISAFPATGKSYFTKNTSLKVLDSDSSNFSWVINEDGTKIRNPNFPKNYIEHIKQNLGKVDIIFVSSHKEVRDALVENNIDFLLIYPNFYLKEQYLERFKTRGNDEKFIKFIDENWDNFLHELISQEKCEKFVLQNNLYISDVISLD